MLEHDVLPSICRSLIITIKNLPSNRTEGNCDAASYGDGDDQGTNFRISVPSREDLDDEDDFSFQSQFETEPKPKDVERSVGPSTKPDETVILSIPEKSKEMNRPERDDRSEKIADPQRKSFKQVSRSFKSEPRLRSKAESRYVQTQMNARRGFRAFKFT